jgi:4-amino-4-deoxy-L-arabinose transferase-like glycosyltransferase
MGPGWTRWTREPAIWILAATAAFYALLVVPYWKPTWDSAIYISLARSLAHGEGYTYMGYAETKYPPGFPLMLSPIVLLFGKDYLLMRAFIAACAVGSVGMAYLLVRRIGSRGIAVAVALSTAAAYALAFEATRVLSDVPFMLVALGALYAGERYRESSDRLWFWWTVGLVVAACSVRMVGVALVFAFAASILIDLREHAPRTRVRRAGIALAVVALVMGAWMGRNALARHTLPEQLREGETYGRELLAVTPGAPGTSAALVPALEHRLTRNLDYYDRLTASILTGRTARSSAVVGGIGIWVILGWLWAMWRRRGMVEYYIALYFAMYFFWPAREGERFLVPVIPILIYYALVPFLVLADRASGVAEGKSRSTRDDGGGRTNPRARARAGVLLVATALFLVWNAPLLIAEVKVEHSTPYYDGAMSDYLAAFAWVKQHLPRGAVLATNRAPYGVLLAERDTYTVPWVTDNTVKLASLRRYGVTDIVANSGTPFLNALIAAYPERFRETHRIGGTIVYHVEGSRGAGPP